MILKKQPKTFVIAIKGHAVSESLLQDCLASAKKFNWNIEVFWGIDGRTITENNWKAEGLFPRLDKPTMDRPGVQGCFLSHWNLWKHCVEINEPIIILEHDAIILKTWESIEIDKSIIKLHRIYSPKKEKIDIDTGQWNKSGHAYCITPTHAKNLINFSKEHGAIVVDILIGSKIAPIINLNPSWVERQNLHSTTNNL